LYYLSFFSLLLLTIKQQAEEGRIIQWVKKSNGAQKQQAEEGQIIEWVKKSNGAQKQ
jgi:3-dehydroquinate dehydratase